MGTYVIAGSSGTVAGVLAKTLAGQGHRLITVSRREALPESAKHLQIRQYTRSELPECNEPVDGLVYFPGTIRLKPFHRITADEFLEDLHINTLGAIELVQHFLPGLQKSGKASVVFISSVAAQTGMPFHSSVSLAKGALEGLAKALAAEYAPHIRFNVVAPSLMDTTMGEKFLNTADKRENARKRNPMKHIGEPKDLSAVIQFLLSRDSGWMTGQTIAVDGGMGALRLI